MKSTFAVISTAAILTFGGLTGASAQNQMGSEDGLQIRPMWSGVLVFRPWGQF